jgi:hypothetical protein
VLRAVGDEVETDFVPGTQTAIHLPGLLELCLGQRSRYGDIYRVRPEQGLGLCRHRLGQEEPEVLCPAPSIASRRTRSEHVVYGGLDGKLYVVPLNGVTVHPAYSAYSTGFSSHHRAGGDRGRPDLRPVRGWISVRVRRGGRGGTSRGGSGDLEDSQSTHGASRRLRIRLVHELRGLRFDEFQSAGFRAPASHAVGATPGGTVKHVPVCGGGRLYTHTAEGQIIAVEQDTGRLLWRRYWPEVYLSFTSPFYVDGKLLVPQAGLKRQSRMRCLDAATGKLLWEAPFTGSPSWSRQFPPVVHGKIAIYASGSGEYAAQGTEKPFTFKGTPYEESIGWPGSDELDLLQRQSVLPARPSSPIVGVGSGLGRNPLGAGLRGLRARRQ